MLDGAYQSVICFYMTYLLFRPAQSVTESGHDLSDRTRMGVFVACSAVIVSNLYVLLNTFRWDWVTVLINAVSSLLIFFWTGVYSTSTYSGQFYGAATEVYGSLTFWAMTLLTIVICLTPRFTIKALQKIYKPLDVDIVREQVIQGKFKYLDNFEAYIPPTAGPPSSSAGTSSDLTKSLEVAPNKRTPATASHREPPATPMAEDERPFYPPSVAPTTRTRTTHNPRSQNGSDGTGYTASLDFERGRRQSVDQIHSWDRP